MRLGPLCLFVALALLAAPASAHANVAMHRDDGAGDVQEGRASTSGGAATWRPVEGHEDIDIRTVAAREELGEVLLELTVEGQIRREAYTQGSDQSLEGGRYAYEWSLDVRDQRGQEDYRVRFDEDGARLEWFDTRNSNARSEEVRSEVEGGKLTMWVPEGLLAPIQWFEPGVAATQTRTNVSQAGVESITWLDVSGTFPNYEDVAGAAGEDAPGPGVLVAVAAAMGAGWARRRGVNRTRPS